MVCPQGPLTLLVSADALGLAKSERSGSGSPGSPPNHQNGPMSSSSVTEIQITQPLGFSASALPTDTGDGLFRTPVLN